ncbi:MAG: hypothetical protein NUV82_00090 [Candidatus Komeilibacteria bacterium]|nr:hypothetical protein [Candidatus Komeilibacteria bacterium]
MAKQKAITNGVTREGLRALNPQWTGKAQELTGYDLYFILRKIAKKLSPLIKNDPFLHQLGLKKMIVGDIICLHLTDKRLKEPVSLVPLYREIWEQMWQSITPSEGYKFLEIKTPHRGRIRSKYFIFVFDTIWFCEVVWKPSDKQSDSGSLHSCRALPITYETMAVQETATTQATSRALRYTCRLLEKHQTEIVAAIEELQDYISECKGDMIDKFKSDIKAYHELQATMKFFKQPSSSSVSLEV